MFVFHWLCIKFTMCRNSFRENKRDFFFRDLWHAAVILFGLALIYVFLVSMFGFIQKKGMSGFDFALIFFSFSLLVLVPLIFYSAVVCSLSFLFQKEENHFYFSLPVHRMSIFTVRFLQTYFHTVWMGFLGQMVFLAALQHYFLTTPLLYLTGSACIAVFFLIPVCAAVILVLGISRFFPFVRAKGMLTVIGLFVGGVLVSVIRLMQPERLLTPEGKMLLAAYLQNLHKPWMTVFPSEWVTSIVFAQVQNDGQGIIVNFLSLAGLATVLIILVYIVAARVYEKIWAEAIVAAAPLASKKFAWQALLNIFPASLRVFIRKDLLSFCRNTIEKGSLSMLIPLGFVYFYSVYLLNKQTRAYPDPIFSFLYIYLFNFFYSAVIIAGLSGRWVFPSVSAEGNNFRLIKGSAVSLNDFLSAKFLLGFIPLLCLGELLIVGSLVILGAGFVLMLISSAVMALLCWGITLLCLILGTRGADFSIQEPLDFALSYRGFLCLVGECIFTVAMVVLVGIPTVLFFTKGFCPAFLLSLLGCTLGAFAILAVLHRLYKASPETLSKKMA